MDHMAGKLGSIDSRNAQGEIPALLVPGGSCSSLCRPHGRDEGSPPQVEPLPEHVRVAAGDEWSRLTPDDHAEIRRGGASVMVSKLSQRYGWDEARALAKLRAFIASFDRPDDGGVRERATQTALLSRAPQ